MENSLLHLFNKDLLRIYFVLVTESSAVDFLLKKEYMAHPQEPTVKWVTAAELHGTGLVT